MTGMDGMNEEPPAASTIAELSQPPAPEGAADESGAYDPDAHRSSMLVILDDDEEDDGMLGTEERRIPNKSDDDFLPPLPG